MSESREKRERQAALVGRRDWGLLRRRVALVLYLCFASAALAGTQGPWWQVFVGENKVGVAMRGPDFMRYERIQATEAEIKANPLKKYEVRQRKKSVYPSGVAVCLLALALLFASGSLVADFDLRFLILLLTLGVAGVAAFVLYDVHAKETVIKEVVELNEARQILGPNPNTKPKPLPALRFEWGFALYVSASLVMLLSSLYLTFASRTSDPATNPTPNEEKT